MTRFLLAIVLVAALLALPAGCTTKVTEPKPDTQNAEGKVVTKDGKPYSTGGVIAFRSDSQPGATAEISENGTFKLKTTTAQNQVEGAVEGEFTVTIYPRSTDQQTLPIELQKKYTIVKGDNNLTVVLE